MNDENKHNDPIERLFREKAGEEYNISYREEDWLKLEKKLDARDLQRSYRRKFGWLAAASVLILALIGYYTVQNHNKISELTEQLNQNESIQQDQQIPGNQDPSVPLDVDENQPEPNQLHDNEEEPVLADNTDAEQPADQTSSQNSEEILTSENEREESTTIITNQAMADAGQTIRFEPLDPVDFGTAELSGWTAVREEARPVELANNMREIMNEPGNFDKKNVFLAMNDDDSSDDLAPFSSSRFAVGVVVSPDLSTAGSVSNFYDPGYKGGILAEYAITKNISLVSGLAISNLKYKAYGEAYDPPPYWNSGVMPDETTALCVVLDIPLNLKANLINFDRSRFFATAGLSSYIMLSEEYNFRYEGGGSGLQSSWSDRTGTRYWLSNAGFSVGFEYDLSPQWSLRAEPHIKVPLKGVGWGEVNLYSLGSFFSLNYKFGQSGR